jgi:hypothetical protein
MIFKANPPKVYLNGSKIEMRGVLTKTGTCFSEIGYYNVH